MNHRIEEKDAFDIIEKVEVHSAENGANESSIPEFWARAYSDGTMEKLAEVNSDKNFIFGICYGNQDKNSKDFEYSIAVKCEKDPIVPDGFRKNSISNKTWLVFTCVGAMPDAIQAAWKKISSEFFPASGYKPTGEMDIEAYTEGDTDSPDYRSEIWVPIEKKQ